MKLPEIENLEEWLHLTELEGAARSALGHSLHDPLRVLMDPKRTEAYEYEYSKTEPVIPAQMHPKQIVALNAEARHRWLFWANQAGKTTLGAIDVALMALGRHPQQRWQPPLLIWASALTWQLWENILLPEILTWIPPDRIIDAPIPNQQSTKRVIRIRADNGLTSRIVGKSAEQGAAKYQSARVHHVWLDEEHPEPIWDELQPRLLRHGGTTCCTATPLLGLTWLFHRIYEPWRLGQTAHHFCSHAGVADNPAIDPGVIEQITREFEHDPAQAEARIFGRFATPTGVALNFDPQKHNETFDEGMMKTVQDQNWGHLCGVDFGYWRFAFCHITVDRANRGHVVGEIFSQKETLEIRARRLHAHLEAWKAPPKTRIWGDAANPTDIVEINREFARIGSPYRVRPVRAEHKARRASVTLVNNLLARRALLFARKLADRQKWRLRQSAASEGRQQVGSRLMYEIVNWRYPNPKEGQAQDQDPNDNSADGADMIAALRYATMSHWKAPKFEIPGKGPAKNRDLGYEKMSEQVKKTNEEVWDGTT